MIELKQLPVATKVWLFPVLDLSSRAKNVLEPVQQPKRSSTLRIHFAFVLPRSLAKIGRFRNPRKNLFQNIRQRREIGIVERRLALSWSIRSFFILRFRRLNRRLKKPLRGRNVLDWRFWSFLIILHYGIEEVERHLLWKFHKKFKGNVGQMCHRSCSLA